MGIESLPLAGEDQKPEEAQTAPAARDDVCGSRHNE
jgi:hypothetical protein